MKCMLRNVKYASVGRCGGSIEAAEQSFRSSNDDVVAQNVKSPDVARKRHDRARVEGRADGYFELEEADRSLEYTIEEGNEVAFSSTHTMLYMYGNGGCPDSGGGCMSRGEVGPKS